MTDDELVDSTKKVDITPLNGVCQFTIANDTPAGWGVTIVAAGANFYYHNGKSETDGPRPVNLQSGGQASFYSKVPSGCVKRIFWVMTINVEGEGTRNEQGDIADVPANQCMAFRGISLGPKRNIAEDEVRKGPSVGYEIKPV